MRIKTEARDKMTQEITGGSVLDTYVHHCELVLRIILCSLTWLFTIHRSIFIVKYKLTCTSKHKST
jgi:hypothetical protein